MPSGPTSRTGFWVCQWSVRAERCIIAASVAVSEETAVAIETRPPKATVSIGGVVKGVSPLELRLPKGHAPVTLEISRPGYQTLRETVVPDVDQRLRLTLLVAAAPRTSTSAPAPTYHRFD